MNLGRGSVIGLAGGALAIVGVMILPWFRFSFECAPRGACTGFNSTGFGGNLLLGVAILGLAAFALEKKHPMILVLVGALAFVLGLVAWTAIWMSIGAMSLGGFVYIIGGLMMAAGSVLAYRTVKRGTPESVPPDPTSSRE